MSDRIRPQTLDAEAITGLDLGGIKLIEASAGTGKTHTIADLYLRHILAGHRPAEILLVTFTNAATEELRGRIRQRLREAEAALSGRRAPPPGVIASLLEVAREADCAAAWLDRIDFALCAMDEAAISTIHGFCQRVLRQFALSSGQYLDSEMIAENKDKEMWIAAIRDWWRRLHYGLETDAWRQVHEALPALPVVEKTLLDLRNKPGVTLIPEAPESLNVLLERPCRLAAELHALGPAWAAERDAIVDFIENGKAISRRSGLAYHPDKFELLVRAADEFFAAPDPQAPFADFEFLGSEHLHRYTNASKRGKEPRIDEGFFKMVDPIARAWKRLPIDLRAALLVDAYRDSARTVADNKRANAVLAFQDQLLDLHAALCSADGPRLAANLRRCYPVAMIDEFQDTDAIQFDIFRRVYIADGDASLTLIGDPKQAIYSFRGGDIFTYIAARRTPGAKHYQLETNWRSLPELVLAINTLFGRRSAPFVFDDAIGFTPASPNPDNRRLALSTAGRPAAPLTVWRLPMRDDGKPWNRDRMREQIYAAIAVEIARLLAHDSLIDGKPLAHGDLAILVRSAREGQQLHRVLRAQGIPGATISRESVFASDEARGLYELLSAVNEYQSQSTARRALASSLLRYDHEEIAAIVDDDRRWQAWVEDLAALNQAWERSGFIPMFQRLMHRFDIAARLAEDGQRERRLTNLLQVAELMQQQSTAEPGPDPLLGWLARQFDAEVWDEAELRLEGDESLVKIVTIHKSKGLQYPVVFVPFLWCFPAPGKPNPGSFFHRDDFTACMDFGGPEIDAHALAAEKERLAEDLRLLYVALTRARSKVYLAWGRAGALKGRGSSGQTALAWLLHSAQQPADLDRGPPDAFAGDPDMDADLAALVADGDGHIEVVALPDGVAGTAPGTADEGLEAIQLARFGRGRLPLWKIASFTGLARGMHPSGVAPPRRDVDIDPICDFPAGSHVGLMLHSLLEHLDFEADVDAQCEQLLPRFLGGVGIDRDRHGATLVQWLRQILRTRLDDSGLHLGQLGASRRLNELEFDFALDRFDGERLNRLLDSLAGARLPRIQEPAFEGLVNGVIDLVFEHEGRYYLADYKSNRLGPSTGDYTRAALERAMTDHRYDLQSLLYTLALHRYLAGRLPNYDYRRHFGGSYYLFLRGMRDELGPSHGVFFQRHSPETLEALERIFGYSPAAVSA